MNRSADILKFLAGQQANCPLILAPHAPPVVRHADSIAVALNIVLSAADIEDTLATLYAQALKAEKEIPALAASGSFSLGIRDIGRIRINYVTQRGSKVATILRIPMKIPDIKEVVVERPAVERLLALLNSPTGSFLAIAGDSTLSNSMLAYALLNQLNQDQHRFIYILERHLAYLMPHVNSVVVQAEWPVGEHALAESAREALWLDPDYLYVGDVYIDEEAPAITQAICAGVHTIISSVALDAGMLVERFFPKRKGLRRADNKISVCAATLSTQPGGKLSITFEETTGA